MKGETIDDTANPGIRANPFFWMGTGAFFLLCINSYGYIFETITRDACIVSDVIPSFTFWSAKICRLIVIIVFVLLSIQRYERALKANIAAKRIFFFTVIAFIISQVIQFFYPLFLHQLVDFSYYENQLFYQKTVMSVDFYSPLYDSGFSTLMFIFVGIVFYRKGSLLW